MFGDVHSSPFLSCYFSIKVDYLKKLDFVTAGDSYQDLGGDMSGDTYVLDAFLLSLAQI